MRYIRTKDGKIIDLVAYKENGVINNGIKFVNKINGSYFFVQQDNILKQADTIEELCDEFVATLKNTKPYIFKDGEYKELEKKPSEWLGTLYGAIWTDKGLIYIAKMNDKGELELI